MIKCDAGGVNEWDVTLGGTDDNFFYTVINTLDSGYLVIGGIRSPLSGNISQALIGIFDLWVVKLSGDGDIEWDKRYGANSSCVGTYALQLLEGGFLLGGYTNSTLGGDVSEPSYGLSD